jgi:hypothetical protein
VKFQKMPPRPDIEFSKKTRSDFEARAMRVNREKFERVMAKVPDLEPEHEWDRIPQK